MNLRFYTICTAALLILGAPALLTLEIPFLADSNITAIVHGGTYEGDTFEPLNDTVIDINSTPPQSIVAKNGMYSFELVPGDYAITARYYQNNTLTYSREATFKIESEGNYVFDLLLYPVSENPVTGENAAKIDNSNSELDEQSKTDFSTISYLLIAFMLILLLGGGYKLSRKHNKIEKNAFQEGKTEEAVSVKELIVEPADNSGIETAALKKLPLSTDLQEVMDIIRSHKGRITQKNLRSRLNYSEVKVSILLSELEKRGLIKKFKNGRENIVVLIDEEH